MINEAGRCPASFLFVRRFCRRLYSSPSSMSSMSKSSRSVLELEIIEEIIEVKVVQVEVVEVKAFDDVERRLEVGV